MLRSSSKTKQNQKSDDKSTAIILMYMKSLYANFENLISSNEKKKIRIDLLVGKQQLGKGDEKISAEIQYFNNH
uniref:Uncharacterized protein n=1 Tax=Onchocerca volvulus TaxID=6282 RepID=A0A8R1TM50_ONCVO